MNLKILWDFLFPVHCISCRKYPESEAPLCAECFNKLSVHQTFFCGTCKARLPEGKKICHPATPFILGAAANYENETVRELIYALKFNGVKSAAIPLGNLTLSYLKPLLSHDVVVVPVPLGKKRLRTRGYNQAELIAKIVSEGLYAPMVSALIRDRETKPQSGLRKVKLREENVAGCFSLSPEIDINKKIVLLIDDVATSGATFREAALVLKRGGAKLVYAVATSKA